MTEKIDVTEVENEEVEEPVEKPTVTQQDKSAKTFTQEELDRTVQNRLRRVREENKQVVDTLTADVTFYEEQFGKVIEAQTSDWDEGMKELFTALPVREQLQKLADEGFTSKVRRKNIPPKTPKQNENPESAEHEIGFGGRY